MTSVSAPAVSAPVVPATYPADVLAAYQNLVDRKVPYLWGGLGAFADDCSGAVKWAFSQAGYTFAARTSQDQADLGETVTMTGTNSLAAALPGDALFFNYEGLNTHEELYAGNGMAYTEARPGTVASLVPVDTAHLDDIQRFVDATGAPLAGVSAGKASTVSVVSAAAAGAATAVTTGTGSGGLLGLVFGGLGSSLLGIGVSLVLVAAGAGLTVLGAYKTADPGRSVTQTLRNAAPAAAALA